MQQQNSANIKHNTYTWMTPHIHKVKSNYCIVRPKVDHRAGLLSLPQLRIFAIHTR